MEEENRQEAVENNQSSNAEKTDTPSLIAAAFQREHPDWTTNIVEALGETTITVPREHIVSACGFMKVTPGFEFDFLADLCGFDCGPEAEPRFEVNYHLFSTTSYQRLRLKVLLNEDDDLDGAAASVDPWRVASGTRARRRDGGEVHARHWLSPHRHGEAIRVPKVSAGHRHHRPHGLSKSAGEQSRVRDGRREIAANRNTGARAGNSSIDVRAATHRFASGLVRHACARYRRHDSFLLLLPRAGKDHELDRSRFRRALDPVLLSHRRIDDGLAGGV